MSVNLQFGFIVEYVQDIERARRFFSETMGLRVVMEHPAFLQFSDDAGVSYGVSTDAPFAGTGEPEIYWVVDDIDEAFAQLSQSAEVAVSPRQMPFGTVFAVTDPDGQPHYVVQFAEVRPSQPVD